MKFIRLGSAAAMVTVLAGWGYLSAEAASMISQQAVTWLSASYGITFTEVPREWYEAPKMRYKSYRPKGEPGVEWVARFMNNPAGLKESPTQVAVVVFEAPLEPLSAVRSAVEWLHDVEWEKQIAVGTPTVAATAGTEMATIYPLEISWPQHGVTKRATLAVVNPLPGGRRGLTLIGVVGSKAPRSTDPTATLVEEWVKKIKLQPRPMPKKALKAHPPGGGEVAANEGNKCDKGNEGNEPLRLWYFQQQIPALATAGVP